MRSVWGLFPCIAAVLMTSAGCGGDGISEPGEDPDADRTHPSVQSWWPGRGATDVPSNVSIEVHFSEPVQSATITASSIFITPAATGTLTYGGHTATFIPQPALQPGVTYTVSVTTAIKDVAGNPLAEPHSWSFTTYSPPPPAIFAVVRAAANHSCGLTPDRVAYCWGLNLSGQLGNGTAGGAWGSAAPVSQSPELVSIAAGAEHNCGLTPGGEAYCWGDNQLGQLGDGTVQRRVFPVRVATGVRFSVLSAGMFHTCGLGTDGGVYCWGWNGVGQFGDGSTDDQLQPVRGPGSQTFVALATGGAHTCALTNDGTAYCWGTNYDGQLGIGTRTPRITPAQVAGDLRFASLAGGLRHTCAVSVTNEAYCWGDNASGQIGDGSTVDRLTPTLIPGGATWAVLSAGDAHSCAIAIGGAVHCWGRNSGGGIGDGTQTNRATPTPVSGGHRFTSISAGTSHSCGTTSDNAAYCWGANFAGQLGDGSGELRTVPSRVVR